MVVDEERVSGARTDGLRLAECPPGQAPAWTAHDRSFVVEGELVPHLVDGRLGYGITSVAPYVKTYADEEGGAAGPDDGEAACHSVVAYLGGQPAGEIVLARHWNGYACVHDLVVGQAFRRRGVARALVEHAIAWSRAQQLAGVTLETQNNNVAACRWYAACGFRLEGFDYGLYQALAPGTREVALFWYWRAPH
ncbi:acetyltransferase [Acidovorax sp. CF316]|uniref:GNAT family N-acetyltransferase n=1 Tax=Acidovorax sp. CF316 TaxID=1144317 RepID=UPI00026BCFCB|nr:GNAT family N-acetyltransferase [Acidovorax sp. CF316]EJE51722.1 acetyltransferase [Acidovorax sp. CF316]